MKKFIQRVGEILGTKILAKPFSFLGVTGFFLVLLYLYWIEYGTISLGVEGNVVLLIVYIVILGIAINENESTSQDTKNEGRDEIEVRQNNISIFSFFKNIKK